MYGDYYKTNVDLPENIQKELPDGAQTHYRNAFNLALEEYRDADKADVLAWHAVKTHFEKNEEGKWVKKMLYT